MQPHIHNLYPSAAKKRKGETNLTEKFLEQYKPVLDLVLDIKSACELVEKKGQELVDAFDEIQNLVAKTQIGSFLFAGMKEEQLTAKTEITCQKHIDAMLNEKVTELTMQQHKQNFIEEAEE
eukprot:11219042-Lingulodinium_polyedra.AAC.1